MKRKPHPPLEQPPMTYLRGLLAGEKQKLGVNMYTMVYLKIKCLSIKNINKHVNIKFLTAEIIIIMTIIINTYNFSGPRLSPYIENLKH